MSGFEPLGPVMVISTHLDDAVLSCAQFIHANPGTTVVTVLAGAPDVYHKGYNSKSTGKPYAPDAVRMRRDEDAKAMSMLSAQYVWLDLLDNDYLQANPRIDDQDEIRDAISGVLRERQPVSVVAPLGLIHADHVAVSDACLELAIRSEHEWYLYMDMPYGPAVPRTVPQRIATVETKVELEVLEPFHGDPDIKRPVMKAYSSQYGPTRRSHRRGFRASMKASEQYWRIKGPTSR